MRDEDITNLLMKIANMWPVLTPVWSISGVICLLLRHKPWITPFWALVAGPVVVLYSLFPLAIVLKIVNEGFGHSPDDGWSSMALAFSFLLTLPETIPGLIVLVAVPRKIAWRRVTAIPCLMAISISCPIFLIAANRMPDDRVRPITTELTLDPACHGLITIEEDLTAPNHPVKVGNIWHYRIPANGVLKTTNTKPFIGENRTSARFDGGEELPDLYSASEGLVSVGTLGTRNNKILIWVGTHAEWNEYLEHNDPWH